MRRPTRNAGGNYGRGSHWIRDTKRRRIYWRDGLACVWCGSSRSLSLDHFLGRDRGGTHEASNLLTCCSACNTTRGELCALDFAFTLPDPCAALDRALEAMARPLPK